jgi:hypothetical protein
MPVCAPIRYNSNINQWVMSSYLCCHRLAALTVHIFVCLSNKHVLVIKLENHGRRLLFKRRKENVRKIIWRYDMSGNHLAGEVAGVVELTLTGRRYCS